MHLDHVGLLAHELILLAVVEPCLEVVGEGLVVLAFVFELGLLELCRLCQYFLEFLHSYL